MIRFAMTMMKSLQIFNHQAMQDFKLRVGIASGPLIAGVVGAVKPQYDIWGDTVNVASRMDTNGVPGQIHITESMAQILMDCNLFNLYCRGSINIKGKGNVVTYLIDAENELDNFL